MINRRQFVTSALATLAASQSLSSFAQTAAKGGNKPATSGAADEATATFPKDFYWGVATAAYQIEGAHNIDGKGESIWDRFVLAPGKIKNGDTGNVACDSYHRLNEDLALLKALGVNSYRFSISWPRVQPDGMGELNRKGLDYYHRLIDGLLKAGIRPFVTLYHWDLPQALEDRGGWPNRQTADYFANYAAMMVKEFGGKVKHWAIFNEPRVFVELGYLLGVFAPGRKDPKAFFAASHVVNLAQGKAFHAMKAVNSTILVGTAVDATPAYPMTQSADDIAAAKRRHQLNNLWYVTPALTGAYPKDVLVEEHFKMLNIQEGDEKLMRAPLDFIGINNYTQSLVKNDPASTAIPNIHTSWSWGQGDHAKTDIGWDISPTALYDILKDMHAACGGIPIEITENGAAFNIGPDRSGRVRDEKRIAYLKMCLSQVERAIKEGIPVKGYHAWSLMDNFEWAEGYAMRFGLVHVDYKTQKRTIKDSGKWYAQVIKAKRVI